MFGKVAVLMGGTSSEREVSLQTGMAVLAALKRQGIDAYGIDAVEGFVQYLIEGRFDRVFFALHGKGFEDGTVAGLLECLQIPYTGSGVFGSALCFNKQQCKRIWQNLGLPTPPYAMVNDNEDATSLVNALGLPVAVKPNSEGSSVGVKKLTNIFDLPDAVKDARQYGEVLIEKWIVGTEVTVGIIGQTPLPVIKIESAETFYDYRAKYFSDQTLYHCPSGLDAETEAKVQTLALQAFNTVKAEGWGRVDLLLDEKGNPWILEVNTCPGLTDTSLVPKAAAVNGLSFDELVLEILSLTFVGSRTASLTGAQM